jgi:hypothetical protein
MARLSKLSSLRNIGPRTETWLNDIGIFTRADLERIGSVNIYRILKQKGHPVSMNLVWGVEGALADVDWREISEELKADVRSQIKGK